MRGPERVGPVKTLPLLPTTVVGGDPRPDWLVNRDGLTGCLPPRVRAKEIWRVAEPMLAGAQDDATILAIRDMKRGGGASQGSGPGERGG